jgi:ParB family chromosome partitioning protein
MRLSTSLVAVKKITSRTAYSEFDREQIELLAQQILMAEGLISPLIISRTDFQSYAVVDGHFEYHAAVRAREIDPRKGEMISAYIIESENDVVGEAIAEQIKLLRQSKLVDLSNHQDSINTPQAIETKIETSQSDSTTEMLRLILLKVNDYESQIKYFESSLNKVGELISQINSPKPSFEPSFELLDESKLEILMQKTIEKYVSETKLLKVPSSTVSSRSSKAMQYDEEKAKLIILGLNTFDVARIKEKLSKAGIKTAKNMAQKICEYRLLEPYKSIEDITSRIDSSGKRFFTENTLIKLLDNW